MSIQKKHRWEFFKLGEKDAVIWCVLWGDKTLLCDAGLLCLQYKVVLTEVSTNNFIRGITNYVFQTNLSGVSFASWNNRKDDVFYPVNYQEHISYLMPMIHQLPQYDRYLIEFPY